MAIMPLIKKKLTPLHVHTAKGSIGDSILKIDEYIKKAKEYGLTHLAITDHGSMNNAYDFYHSCREKDITPIIGCEVYEAIDREAKTKDDKGYWHLVLIAKNDIGLKNLLYITTDANLNGYYYKPRTDISVLKEHGEGIIALSACLGGKVPQLLSGLTEEEINNTTDVKLFNEAIEAINEYKQVFDEFYLEIQPGNFEQQILINKALVLLGEYTDTPLVVTNDIHYLEPEDHYPHDIHVKMAQKKQFDDDPVYPDKCYYFQNYKTIKNSFPYLPTDVVEKAINNTNLISLSCNVNLDVDELHMPIFSVPEHHTEESWLSKLCFEKINAIKNILKDPAEYITRTLYELEVISELGYAGYFLTVRDFIIYAKENNIPVGPGRGSVCGSLVAFLADITMVDPIQYKLLFERFLSIHRKGSIPDYLILKLLKSLCKHRVFIW